MRTSSNLAEVKIAPSHQSTLTHQATLTIVAKQSAMKDPLNELLSRKTIRQHIQEFAAVLSIVATLGAAYLIYKHSDYTSAIGLLLIASVLTITGYRAPARLHKLWKGWLAIGNGIGAVVTTLLLSIMWLTMFIPVSIGLRIFHKKVMDMTFREKGQASYWKTRDSSQDDFKLLERQF